MNTITNKSQSNPFKKIDNFIYKPKSDNKDLYAPLNLDTLSHIFSFLTLEKLFDIITTCSAFYSSIWDKDGVILTQLKQRKAELLKANKSDKQYHFIINQLILHGGKFDVMAKDVINQLFGTYELYFDKNITLRIMGGVYDATDLVGDFKLLKSDNNQTEMIDKMISANRGKYLTKLWEKQQDLEQLRFLISFLKEESLDKNLAQDKAFEIIAKSYAKLGDKKNIKQLARLAKEFGNFHPDTYFKCAKIFAKNGDAQSAYYFLLQMEQKADPYMDKDELDLSGCRKQIEMLLTSSSGKEKI